MLRRQQAAFYNMHGAFATQPAFRFNPGCSIGAHYYGRSYAAAWHDAELVSRYYHRSSDLSLLWLERGCERNPFDFSIIDTTPCSPSARCPCRDLISTS